MAERVLWDFRRWDGEEEGEEGCSCDREAPWCSKCVVDVVVALWDELGWLSVNQLCRRVPKLKGREGALLVSLVKRWIKRSEGVDI